MIHIPTIALVCLACGSMFALVGCGKQEAAQTVPTTAASPPASVAAPAGSPPVAVEKVARPPTVEEVALVPDGTQLISPDSGKPVVKNASTPALVYDGRLYFLCCATCAQKCQANPSLLLDAKVPNGYELRKLAGSSS
jgi:hypothetical protein